MYKIVFLFLLIFVSQFANSEEEINKANGVENNSEGDVRQFVTGTLAIFKQLPRKYDLITMKL
jgi:hypothetical protein